MLLLIVAFVACDGAPGQACDDEYTRPCACGNGTSGMQTCHPAVGWSDCACNLTSSGPADPFGNKPTQDAGGTHTSSGGSGSGSSTSGGSGLDTPPMSEPDAGTGQSASGPVGLARGASALLELFVQDDDTWIVDVEGVRRLSVSSGAELAHWQAPSALSAAAFDGARLVVADDARLTVLDPSSLVVQRDGALVAGCAALVLFSGDRLVCGSRPESDRVFYTYDVASCDLVSQSAAFSGAGTAMRPIPGRDAFFTIDDEAGVTYFELDADGRAMLGSAVGDRLGSEPFTFDADQAKHVVDASGTLLALEGCTATTPNECLAVDGSLGTLSATQRFIALDHVDSTVVGLVTSEDNVVACRDQACRLQRIEVPTRTLRTQHRVHLPLARVMALRAQASQKYVLIAYEPPTFSADASTTEYVVARLPLHGTN